MLSGLNIIRSHFSSPIFFTAYHTMLHNADALAEKIFAAILFRRCAQNSIARSRSDEQVIYYPL